MVEQPVEKRLGGYGVRVAVGELPGCEVLVLGCSNGVWLCCGMSSVKDALDRRIDGNSHNEGGGSAGMLQPSFLSSLIDNDLPEWYLPDTISRQYQPEYSWPL